MIFNSIQPSQSPPNWFGIGLTQNVKQAAALKRPGAQIGPFKTLPRIGKAFISAIRSFILKTELVRTHLGVCKLPGREWIRAKTNRISNAQL